MDARRSQAPGCACCERLCGDRGRGPTSGARSDRSGDAEHPDASPRWRSMPPETYRLLEPAVDFCTTTSRRRRPCPRRPCLTVARGCRRWLGRPKQPRFVSTGRRRTVALPGTGIASVTGAFQVLVAAPQRHHAHPRDRHGRLANVSPCSAALCTATTTGACDAVWRFRPASPSKTPPRSRFP
jgi:hypothetical protein